MYLNAQVVENYSPGNHVVSVDCGAFSVSFVQAWHSSSEIVDGKPVYLGNPAGLIVQPKAEKGKILYHMGDTDIFSDMGLIQELHKPNIGIVPIGDRFTMGARKAALACRRFFTFDTVIPCHYGTFSIIDPDASKFVAEMGDKKVLVPKIGQPVEI